VAVGKGRKIGIALAAVVVLVVSAYTVIYPPNFNQSVPVCGSVVATTVLSANIGPCKENGLTIGADGAVLNCAGYTISGTGTEAGINLTGMKEVKVENCKVNGFQYGFLLTNSSSNTLANNSANGNGFYGFYVGVNSNNNTLSSNKATNNSYDGFALTSSSNTLRGNTATNNSYDGFALTNSSDNSLNNNTANGNSYGFDLTGSISNTLSGNTAKGNGAYGYADDSGSGPAGTGNAYTGDICSGNGVGGSRPSGLCTPQS